MYKNYKRSDESDTNTIIDICATERASEWLQETVLEVFRSNMKDGCTQQIVQEITTEKSYVGDSVSAEPFGCEQLFDNSTFIENEPLTGGDDHDTETKLQVFWRL